MATRMVKRTQPLKSAPPAARSERVQAGVVAALLVALVWSVFGQTLWHDFVNYDDPSYVYENPIVTKGITVDGLKWAFTHAHARNWHPLTTLSHMLDCQLFGLKPGGHHFTNVLFHSVTAVLLFLVLRAMTAALWPSAFIAAVFAIHPLRAESVAWIAERKDVLSGLFFALSIGAYHSYTRQRALGRYLLLTLLLALGLMSKPMLVTVPVVLLLLDWWPLQRFSPAAGRGESLQLARALVLEKLPLFALALAAGLTTLLIQKTGGAMTESLPLSWRVANAFVSCVAYLRDLFWPGALAPFYPHPEGRFSGAATASAMALVLCVTAAAIYRRRENPYLMTGWLWYLCMLAPVAGIVDVGAQARADRYTYLPHIAVLFGLAWAVRDVVRSSGYGRIVCGVAAAAYVGLLAWRAHAQTSCWRDSARLWSHTLTVTSNNHVAHNNMGELHSRRGEIDKALPHYEKALEIRAQSRRGRYDFLLALYHNNVGSALQRKGATADAVAHYEQAIQIQPDYAEAYLNLGGALVEQGRNQEAVTLFRRVVAMQPKNAQAHTNLATAVLGTGDERAAVSSYEKALEIAPETMTALNNLGWLLATSRDPAVRNAPRAAALIQRAIEAGGDESAYLLHKLAAAQAANGDTRAARQTAERALQLASQEGDAALARELQRNLSFYRAGRPLTEAGERW